jgi:hypothetical protein
MAKLQKKVLTFLYACKLTQYWQIAKLSKFKKLSK